MIFTDFAASMKSQRSTTSNDRFGASSATTELDDLMTQLDDLKLPSGPGEEPVSSFVIFSKSLILSVLIHSDFHSSTHELIFVTGEYKS